MLIVEFVEKHFKFCLLKWEKLRVVPKNVGQNSSSKMLKLGVASDTLFGKEERLPTNKDMLKLPFPL
jgi:hypothetical protein